MSNPYFRNLPEFEYINRTESGRNEGDYSVVKNFFNQAMLDQLLEFCETTKNWKDKELFSLLSEAWGYKTSEVTEGEEAYKKEDETKEKPDNDGDGVPNWADKNPNKAGGDEDRLEEADCGTHKIREVHPSIRSADHSHASRLAESE